MFYYFMHVPKTGGTTFSKFLDRHFNHNKIFLPSFNYELKKKSFFSSKYNLVRGHFKSHKIFFRDEKKVNLITILRDPYKRYISQINHKIYNKIYKPDLYKKDNFQLLKNNIFSDWILTDKIYPEKNKNNKSHDFILNQSKKYIKNFFFVGILEKFNESLLIMSILLKSRPIKINQETVHSHQIILDRQSLFNSYLKKEDIKKEFNFKTYDLWKLSNKIDLEIYKFALKEFNKKLNLYLENYNKKVIESFKNFADINTRYAGKDYEKMNFADDNEKKLFICAYSNYLKKKEIYKEKREFVITGNSILNGDGWHRREFINQLDFKCYYWSGPEQCSDIHIPRWIYGNINLELELRAINNKIKPSDIAIRLNGILLISKVVHSMSLSKIIINAKGFVHKSLLPFSVLSFHVPRVQRISEFYNNEDYRLVGFAFDRILIKNK